MKYNLYDFDGTIYDGDSGVDFVFWAIRKYPKFIFKILGSLGVVILYLLKLRTKEDLKNRLFSFIKDIPNIDAFVEEFWEKHENKIKSFWKDKKNHKKDIIISASFSLWLKPIATRYKICELIATEYDIETCKIIGNNCHGEEKVKLFYWKYPKGIVEKMYTDSINDLPLIKEAKEGYLVKRNKIYSYFEYKPNFVVRFWRWGWGIYHKNEELWNYLIVGGLTTLVSLVTKWILLGTVFDASNAVQLQAAVVVSWIVAVIFAYVTNRIYVFKSKSKKILKEVISFFGARLITLGMEMLIMWFFVTFLRMNVYLWTILAQVLIVIMNYVFSKIFVFRKEH